MSKYTNKRIGIIGAGIAAEPILKKARELGVETFCFSTLKGACAKDYADNFYDINIFDIDSIFDIMKKIGLDGVMASSEITTEIAAVLADRLGLPGNDVKNGFGARNKYVMRRRVSKLGTVEQPDFQLYYDGYVPKFPVVVKALDSYGKKGISLAFDESDYEKAIEYSREISKDVLIEEYIDGGTEYSVECLSDGDRCYVIQITEKETSGPPHFVELGHHQPANVTDSVRQMIITAATDILKALGICCGMAHLELKIKDEKPYFIEVGARAGGDSIGDILVALSTDYDYYKAAIDAAMGIYEHSDYGTVAHSGIYFLCNQTRQLLPLFKNASKFDWCYSLQMNNEDLQDISGNGDDLISGKLIYKGDRKITMADIENQIVEIKDFENAYDLMMNFNREIAIYKTEDEMKETVEKFLKLGNPIGIIKDGRLIAYFNLYCNNMETLEAYFGNLYVLNEFRRQGIAKRLVQNAFEFAKDRGFKKIMLHVADDNISAIKLYEGLGFEYTGNTKIIGEENTLEMCKTL